MSDVLKAKRAPEPTFGIVRETLRGAAALLSRHTLSHALCVGIVPQRWQTNNRGRFAAVAARKAWLTGGQLQNWTFVPGGRF